MTSERDADIQRLIDEVRWLRDRHEILDCINRYGRGLDQRLPPITADAQKERSDC